MQTILCLTAPPAELAARTAAAAAALRAFALARGQPRCVGVHVRCGDNCSTLPPRVPAEGGAPPAPGDALPSDAEWRDTGPFAPAPLEDVLEALRGLGGSTIFLATDDRTGAVRARLEGAHYAVLQHADIEAAAAAADEPDAAADQPPPAYYSDWAMLAYGGLEALVTSNSTFSFTAALIATGVAASAGEPAPRCLRPALPRSPGAPAFREFEPWNEYPLDGCTREPKQAAQPRRQPSRAAAGAAGE
jgi:hypothetical protein